MLMEVQNLYRDRNEHEEEQARTRREEREAFRTIVDGLKTSITNN